MKKLITLAVIVFAAVQLFAQVQFNPQFGMSFMSIKNPPTGVTYDGKVGAMLGADFRFGEKIQFQPGVFYVNSVTAYKSTNVTTTSGDLTYKSIKLKALAAYNIIDGGEFKFRVNFGPAYDFLLSAKEKESGNDLKEDFKKGTFFLQGGLGADILFLTADLGYAYGLTKTFTGESAPDSKNAGLYFTVGVVFGKGK
jgi:hypothetical protein